MARPIIFQKSDFIDLALFQLAKHWAKETHPGFSPHELKKIQPIVPRVAERIYRILEESVLSRVEMPVQNFFSCGASSLDAEALNREAAKVWIEEHIPRGEEKLIVSWTFFGRGVAAVVGRKLFVNRWDAFCYPSSEDLDIWTPGLSFVLQYSHDGVFSFKTA